MPFGLFLALARGLVLPGLGGRKAQVRHRPAVLGATNFGIGAQIADQDHLVDASRHDCLRSFPISPTFGLQPSAGPALGKGDRRAMAVIHTASRHAAYPNVRSYFVPTISASANAKYEVASTLRRPSQEKVA